MGALPPEKKEKLSIGVLALQGAFHEHAMMLQRFSQEVEKVILIKLPKDILENDLDAIIIPGGESTTMALIGERNGLFDVLRLWVKEGRPVWGTCAGMILLSNSILNPKKHGQTSIGGLEVTTNRNYFGSQISSFESPLQLDFLEYPEVPFRGVFIRAPSIHSVEGEKVQILGRLSAQSKYPNVIIAVRQGPILATAFHPELTNDDRLHRYFIQLIREHLC